MCIMDMYTQRKKGEQNKFTGPVYQWESGCRSGGSCTAAGGRCAVPLSGPYPWSHTAPLPARHHRMPHLYPHQPLLPLPDAYYCLYTIFFLSQCHTQHLHLPNTTACHTYTLNTNQCYCSLIPANACTPTFDTYQYHTHSTFTYQAPSKPYLYTHLLSSFLLPPNIYYCHLMQPSA